MKVPLNEKRKQWILDKRKEGYSYGVLAFHSDISRARVHQICSGYNSNLRKLNYYIFVRDVFKCQMGKICKGEKVPISKLVVHHMDNDDRNNESSNLVTLCNKCHLSLHSMEVGRELE